jgi:serine protease inhibitor
MPPKPDAAQSKLLAANETFSFRLFAAITSHDPGSNVFISPLSVAMALGVVANGAAGETRQAILRALQSPDASLDELNAGFARLLGQYDTPESDQEQYVEVKVGNKMVKIRQTPEVKFLMAIANSLWARQDIALKPDFVQRAKEFYQADVASLNFADPASIRAINAWAADRTNGKITEIIDQIDPMAGLVVANAIYFKAYWEHEFQEAKTKDTVFTLLDGKQKRHPVMYQTDEFRYYRGPDFQAISLPYWLKDRADVSMYVFLPDPAVSLTEWQSGLNAENWQNWMRRFRKARGEIGLPRFDFGFETSLNDALSALGMGEAFVPRHADFSALCDWPAWLDQVRHKAVVTVDEEGTEAAAVTFGRVMALGMGPPTPAFRMIVDRPFFFAIRDNTTGAILFMGTVVEPG